MAWDETMARAVREALKGNRSIDAVYSIGGGNRATLTERSPPLRRGTAAGRASAEYGAS